MEGDAGAASLRGGRGRGRGRGTGTGPAASSSPELTPQNPITAPSAAPVPIPVPGPPRARPLPPAALSNTQSAPSFSAESSSPAVASAPVPAPIPVPGPKTGVRPPPPGGSGGVPIPAPISVPGPTRGGSLRGTGRHSSYTPPAESPAAETPSDALPATATATVSGPGPSALGGAPVPGERRAMSGYQNESPLQPAAGSSSPSPVKFPPPPVTGLAKPPAASPPGAPPRFRGAPPAPARSPLQEAPAVTSSEEAAPAEEPATEEENGADANGSEDGEKPSWQGASSRRVRSAVPGAFGAISPKGEPLSAARVAAPPPPASTGAIPVPSAVPKSLTPQPGRRIGSIGVPGGVNFGSLPAESKLAALASAEAEDAQRPSPAKREAIQRSTSSGAIAAAPLLKPRSSGVVTAPPDSAESASSPESSPLASPGAVPAPKIVEPKKPRKVDPNAPAPPPREPEIVGLRKAEDLPELPPRNIANKVASAAPTTTKKTREELRQNCLNEIYETEKGYVEDLETIINVFILPLRLKQAVTESILKNIFSNVEVLVSFNKELLALLEVRIKDTSGIDVQVGDIFVKMGDYLKAYKVYCSNQATSLSTLEFQTKKNAQFKSTIDIAHNDAHCKGMFLSFFLIKPIQRVCKYPLLLRELIRYTPEEHSDFDPLNKAYEKINEVVSDINEATRVSEGLTRTLELQRCIDGLEIELVSPNRRLVRENEITFHKNAKTKHGEKRYIFLFTDLIILATKKGNNKYDHKFHVELGHAKLTVLADTPYIKYAFEVTPLQKKQKCILSCETDNEQREWVKIIKKLIKDFQLREVQEKKRNKLAGE